MRDGLVEKGVVTVGPNGGVGTMFWLSLQNQDKEDIGKLQVELLKVREGEYTW